MDGSQKPADVTLDPARRALLDRWLRERGHVEAEIGSRLRTDVAAAICKRPATDQDIPLSAAQERLWLLEQLQPGSAVYHIPTVMRLGVAVDPDVLQRSLSEIVRRHESLRTVFRVAAGRPQQVVGAPVPVQLGVVDLTAHPQPQRDSDAQQIAVEEKVRPFNLAEGPLYRFTLLRLGPAEHWLLATFHHIICDGWSVGIFVRELKEVYTAYARQTAYRLAELPIQYADYAIWQRSRTMEPAHAEQREYWTGRLADLPPTEVASDWPRPAVATFRAGRATVQLPASVGAALRMLGQREGATTFMVLLSALYILLQRYTGHDDLTVGTSVAGRNRPEIEGLIGCFLNTLVLRADLSGDPRVDELLARVRELTLAAYANQAVPFEHVLQSLQPTRDLSRTPLFQVYLNLLNVGEFDPAGFQLQLATRAAFPAEGGSAEEPYADAEETTTPFDLSLYALPAGDRLALSLVYNKQLFRAETAVQFQRDLRVILVAMIENPSSRISTLPLGAAPADTEPVRVPPRTAHRRFLAEDCRQSIAARFEEQVRLFPDQIAIRTPNTSWTYEVLDHQSGCLAAQLHKQVGTGVRIALLFGHDATMVAAVLAVLRSGNAYVPLDSAHPIERLAAIVDDAQVSAILTDDAHRACACELAQHAAKPVPVISAPRVAEEPASELEIDPAAAGYILYTSGSTGTAKGVLQSHHNVLGHTRAYTNALRIGPDDTLALLANYAFDAAVMDLFGALLNGACLLAIDVRALEAATVAAHLQEATILHCTPTVYRHVLRSLDADIEFAKVRAVVLGGEPAMKLDVDLHRRHFNKDSVFINGLGPTESTMALQYFVPRDAAVTGTYLPVGYPVEDTHVRLVNADGDEVGDLAVGEIVISSDCVALEYWRRAELTRKAFRDVPGKPGHRAYFTGDLGRRLRNGCIEFAGRRDSQVKIRGVRVEPAEVETALLEHDGVSAAAVIVRQAAEAMEMIAYLVPATGARRLTAKQLRRILRSKLPDASIPKSFVWLDRLPLMATGKVDRHALALLNSNDVPAEDSDEPFTPPQGPTEQHIAQLWQEVLAVSSVGRHDNFFEFGGHSLLATQLISRIRITCGVAISLSHFFEQPTIAALAERIAQAQQSALPQQHPNDSQISRAARDRHRVPL